MAVLVTIPRKFARHATRETKFEKYFNYATRRNKNNSSFFFVTMRHVSGPVRRKVGSACQIFLKAYESLGFRFLPKADRKYVIKI